MSKSLIISLILCYASAILGQANFFDKGLSNCIVSLEKIQGDQLISHGTGFLIHNYEDHYKVYLVTCAHLLNNPSIVVKVPTTERFREYAKKENIRTMTDTERVWIYDGYNLFAEYKLILDSTYVRNDLLDVGILPIMLPSAVIYKNDTIRITDRTTIPKSIIKGKKEIELGTEIYFLGFPFSIGTQSGPYSDQISNPLLRTGIVAWKSDNSKEFLLDAFSYNGNSGSPVFSKREVFGGSPYLVGMATGHLIHPSFSGQDINIGLARCIWSDDILELCKRLIKINQRQVSKK